MTTFLRFCDRSEHNIFGVELSQEPFDTPSKQHGAIPAECEFMINSDAEDSMALLACLRHGFDESYSAADSDCKLSPLSDLRVISHKLARTRIHELQADGTPLSQRKVAACILVREVGRQIADNVLSICCE